jgi:hypothetical protein
MNEDLFLSTMRYVGLNDACGITRNGRFWIVIATSKASHFGCAGFDSCLRLRSGTNHRRRRNHQGITYFDSVQCTDSTGSAVAKYKTGIARGLNSETKDLIKCAWINPNPREQ